MRAESTTESPPFPAPGTERRLGLERSLFPSLFRKIPLHKLNGWLGGDPGTSEEAEAGAV